MACSVAKSVVMKITVERKRAEQVEADALIVPVFQGRRDARFGAADLFDSGEISGKPLELTLLHHPPGVRATRVLLAGAGKPEKFDAAEMRRLSGAALRCLKAKSIKSVAFVLDSEFGGDEFASAAVEGAILGDFEPDRYKKGDDKKSVDGFTMAGDTPGLDAAVERGRVLAEAQNYARGMVNEPANRLTPLAHGGCRAEDGGGIRTVVRGAGPGRDGEAGHGLSARRGDRQRRTAGADRIRITGPPIRGAARTWDWLERASRSIPAASPSNRPTAWRR